MTRKYLNKTFDQFFFFTIFALLIFIKLFRAALGSALQFMGLPGVLVKRNSATMRGKSQFLLVCHIYYAYVPTHQNLSFKNFPPFQDGHILVMSKSHQHIVILGNFFGQSDILFLPVFDIHILSCNFGLLVCFFLYLQQKPQRRASSEILIRTKRKERRFYEEYEYERRLKKRRAKLITATEEAFAHIKRMPGDHMKGKSNFSQKKKQG